MNVALVRGSFVYRLVCLTALCALALILSLRGSAGDRPRGAAEQGEDSYLPGRYVHVALYTFKADVPKGTLDSFAMEAENCFRQVPSVRGFRLGQPAKPGTPALWGVQPRSDYHLGVVLSFEDFAGLAKYGNDPRNVALKQKYGKFFEKIVVFDFES